MGGAF